MYEDAPEMYEMSITLQTHLNANNKKKICSERKSRHNAYCLLLHLLNFRVSYG